MNLCQIPGRAGALLTTLLRHISTINGFDNLMAQPLLSDEPLTALMDHYLDTDALADGLPLYVSLYPTEGGMQDIIDCIRAELGVGTTKNAVFQHIQSLPRGQQKEALLASAALPLLFRPREVQGTMFGDGGMGGWRNMQGNTPVTPLVDAGCNMVIVTHLSDGSLWDRQAFPDTTILEIRPRKRLKYAGDGGNSGGLLSFTSAHTDAWRQQGYEDTMLAMEHIRKPLAARQALTRSEAVLQKSQDITEEADLALRNAMARIK
ncbi:TPA: ferredoxin reductase [Escherichia coli]|nr:ferredoxin reductase [Escherichia coli]EFN8398046.1 ferredoxin reductase [Escherichia coli O26]EEZ6603712.1 ferredoxin reductase [Escherichia coli]EFA4346503.1 ferredoxin reductase [Escherichia coli]EFA5303463.1 ferredoxin reductase [Escherichia coli]